MDIEESYSGICRLIGDCLHPDCEFEADSITPEIEKGLLISLSQVFRQNKEWILELESDSDKVSAEESDSKGATESCFSSGSKPHEHHCLANIVAYLVSFLSIQKPLIQHLAAKILVAISEFSSSWETHWEEYIQLLCCWLKFALRKSSFADVVSEAMDSNFNSLISVLPMKMRLQYLNYVTAASILRVLRDVLKLLRSNMDDKLLELYLELITDTFSYMQSLNEVYTLLPYCESFAGSDRSYSLNQGADQSKSIAIFYGNLVQLCCSLVDVSDLAEAVGNTDAPPVISQIKNLIPKLILCIMKPEDFDDARICHYLRHKILMLLIRLVEKVHLECSDLNLWLHIIESYFQDLLLQPIEKVNKSNHEDCLEGSPFWVDDVDAEKLVSSRHLQRLVVFFLLRCSLTLENLKEKADKDFPIVNPASCTSLNLHLHSNFSRRSEGLSVFQKWLMRHLPTDIFVDNEEYLQRCLAFAQSFLKLFMHEDDLLFEMLLQLFSIPCHTRGTGLSQTTSSTKMDFVILISELLNPIHLFHLFLAEILYDHQVLLDYLISKDTGAKSAEYLLKCLRMVCNSWKLFVEFPAMGKSANSSRNKRQKLLANLEFQNGLGTALLEDATNSSITGTDCKEDCTFGSKNGRFKRLSFTDAKCCLLSLKTSISSLNQKHLFPYNPEALLRRLSRFQELCSNEIEE